MKKLVFLFTIILFCCSSDEDSILCVFDPTLQTSSVTNRSDTSATLNGTINIAVENCAIAPGAQQGFVYATGPQPTIEDNLINIYGEEISVPVEDLEPNTTYFVRTFISNSIGEYYGNEVSFSTSNSIDYGINEYGVLFQGLDRDYIVYVPESYQPETPSPLLFVYHGFGGNNESLMNYTGFNEIADQENFIVVYPQGSNFLGTPHWNVGGWTVGSTADDVAFTSFLINIVTENYTINSDRIYATGMSNGGFMSFLLACQMSTQFAAVASVTGSMTPETLNECSPTRAVPVLQIHGTNDVVVPYNGIQPWNTPIDDVLGYWVENNQCNSTPQINSLEDVNTANSITVDEIVFENGTNSSVVKHYKVYGGEHFWFTNADIKSSELVWAFFSTYDLNGLID